MSKTTNHFSLPQHTQNHLALLGQRLKLARVRRGISTAMLGSQCGVSRNTISAMELGRPGVAIGVYVTVLWALGIDDSIQRLADPDADTHGKTLEAARRPVRARPSKLSIEQYDF